MMILIQIFSVQISSSKIAQDDNQILDKNVNVNLFQNLKLTRKIDFIDNIYEIYEGTYQQEKETLNVFCFIIINAQPLTTNRFEQVKSKHVPKLLEACYVTNNYYLIYEKPEFLVSLKDYFQQYELQQAIAIQIVQQLLQITKLFHEKSLCLNFYDPKYIFIDNNKNMTYLSVFGMCDNNDTQRLSKILFNFENQNLIMKHDVYMIARLIYDISDHNLNQIKDSQYKQYYFNADQAVIIEEPKIVFNQFQGEFQKLLNYMTCKIEHRIEVQQLFDHPLFYAQSQHISSVKYLHSADFKESQFEFIKHIGEGSYGTVNLYQFIPTHENVVIKANFYRSINNLESQILKRLIHPNIVQLYGSFKNQQKSECLVMQYAQKGDLFDNLTKQKQPLSLEQQYIWISQLASAIYYLHNNSIIHLDIKLQNILVDKDNNLLLTDFGVSKLTRKQVQNGQSVGTLLYTSPEQYFGLGYSFPADIFSLGLVFCNIILKIHPFKSNPNNIKEFFETLKKNQNCNKFCERITDKRLRQIVNAMLIYNPKYRITAKQLCMYPEITYYCKLLNLPSPNVKNNFSFQLRFYQERELQVEQFYKQVENTKQLCLKFINKYKISIQKYRNIIDALLPYYVYRKQCQITQNENLYMLYYCDITISRQSPKNKVQVIYEQNCVIIKTTQNYNYYIKIVPVEAFVDIDTEMKKYKEIYIFCCACYINQQKYVLPYSDIFIITQNIIVEHSPISLDSLRAHFIYKKATGPFEVLNCTYSKFVQDKKYAAKNNYQIDDDALSFQDYFSQNGKRTPFMYFVQYIQFCFPNILLQPIVEGKLW